MSEKENKSYCPFSGARCNDYCGLWMEGFSGCALTVLTQRLANMETDVYWLRRSTEDNQ